MPPCKNITLSQWHHNRVCDVTSGVYDHITFSFKEPHAISVLNGYSASSNSGDLETEWWGVRMVANQSAGNNIHFLWILV